ncbi:MAG: bifunctional nuclease family protein [Candidatus Aenigmarchaeota archaeon]|nr:bifunctional nuclease family protein [Candidatus Aenigmarchaeota archaeon]
MPSRKRRNTKNAFLAVLFLVLLAAFLAKSYTANKIVHEFSNNTVELDGIDMRYEPGPVLYFSRGCDGIKMGITNDQAFSIEEGLTKERFARPLTHDLFFETSGAFKVNLIYAKIDSITEGVYTAKLLFSDGYALREIDSRPSDMAALTLRFKNKFGISGDLVSNMTYIC